MPVSPSSPPKALCPSSTCSPGAILLGIVEADGTVAFLDHRRVVDDFFVKLAHEGRTPEKRFRFADTCVKSGCRQWGNGRCGVIDGVLAANPGYREGDEFAALHHPDRLSLALAMGRSGLRRVPFDCHRS